LEESCKSIAISDKHLSLYFTQCPISEAILCCEILNITDPLYLKLSAKVLGLSVEFSQPLKIDFGSSNKLGQPVSRSVTVSNTSGVPTSLETMVITFPPAVAPKPPIEPKPGKSLPHTCTPSILHNNDLFIW